MNSSYNKTIAIALLFATLATACSDSVEQLPPDSSPIIGMQSAGVGTRAYSSTRDSTTFGIYAFTCPDGTFANQTPDRLYNIKAEQISGTWVYAPPAQWPADIEKVQFFAYTPHNSAVASGAIVVSPAEKSGIPEVILTLGIEKGPLDFALSQVHAPIGRIPNPGSEEDWMKTRQENYVNFRFDRQLAEVAFRGKYIQDTTTVGKRTRMYINYLTLKNIYRRAKYTYNSTAKKYDITDLSMVDAVSGATMNLSNSTQPIATDKYSDLNNPSSVTPSYLRMIPQTYDNVELTVNYTLQYLNPVDICEYQVTGDKRIPLSVDWERGKRYLFDLEFYFSEVFGLNPRLEVLVTPWVENIQNIPID